ncbi:MAG: hypothetical protein II707_07995 [Spirochaetales bacterium]|nr:hypothetical protein [Spirochaetales bacterium]
MSIDLLNEKITALPDVYLMRLFDYVNYLTYEAEKQARLQRFKNMCSEAQIWAKEVGLTEQDIEDTIKEIRRKKREKKEQNKMQTLEVIA